MSPKITTLGEHIATQKGFAFKSGWFCDSGRPVVKVKDFTANSVDPTNVTHVSDEIAEQYLKYQLRTGDVVIQTVGSWPSAPASVVGKCVRVPRAVDGALLNQNAVKLLPSKTLDGGFLYYSLKNPAFGEYIVGAAQGAASQAAITLEAIRAYKLNLPDLPTQCKIAGMLSTYDELIESNQRRIKILEEMAKSLYREWFVHFRYPGNTTDESDPCSSGIFPKGWKLTKLSEILQLDKGVSYNGAGLTEQGNPMVNLKNIQPGGGFRRDASKPYSGDFKLRHTVKPGDVVLANTDLTQAGNVVASPALIPRNFIGRTALISHHLFAVRPVVDGLALFIYHLMMHEDFRGFAKGFAIGTTVLGMPKEGVLEYSFVCPPDSLIQDFIVRVSPMHELMEVLHERTENLRSTRDLLLPKLLSNQHPRTND